MARISLEPRRGMVVRLGEMYARLRFGRVADPVRAIGHSPGVMVGLGLLEMAAARWHRVDPKLTHLALMRRLPGSAARGVLTSATGRPSTSVCRRRRSAGYRTGATATRSASWSGLCWTTPRR